MARPPARKEGEPLKPFIVANKSGMMGFDGEFVRAGDTVMLTQEQAAHYQPLGTITFDMGAIFDDAPATDSAPETEPKPKTKQPSTKSLGEL